VPTAEATLPPAPVAARGRSVRDRAAVVGWLPLALIVVIAAVGYGILALRCSVPVMWPDEFRYAHLARSLADGHGFEWRGDPARQSAALYVYALTPIWALWHSTTDAYHVSKLLGALALSAQAIPVYLVARRLIGRRLAWAPALLSVGGTWMLTSAALATEAVAMPLATTALCVLILTVAAPSRRNGFLALLFALLAAWARIELVLLLPVIVGALGLDGLRHGSRWRERVSLHRSYLAAATLISIVLLVAALVSPSLAGDYAGAITGHYELGRLVRKMGLELLALLAVAGFLPVTLGVAAAARKAAWIDPLVGPLVCVFVPLVVGVAVTAGMFLAVYTPAWWAIERYVAYAVPIACLVMCGAAVRGLLTGRSVAIAAGAGAVLLLHPGGVSLSEERGAWSISYRVHQLLGTGTGVGLALIAMLAAGLVAVLVRRRMTGDRLVLGIVAITATLMLVQDQASWHVLSTTTRTFRGSMPRDLAWVDHTATGPVALLGLTQNAPGFEILDFFNRDITQVYGPPGGLRGRPPEGQICAWDVQEGGGLRFQPGCGPTPHAFLINDPYARMTFHDELASSEDPHVGRVVRVAAGVPRLQSVIVLPCPRLTPTFSETTPHVTGVDAPFQCSPGWYGKLWLDSPATLVARYAGGRNGQVVSAGARRWLLPARHETSIRVSLPSGTSTFSFRHDWTLNLGNPRLVSVELDSGGRAQPVI